MPKARAILRRLQRDGWREIRRKGSHRRLQKGSRQATFAYHDGDDLGNQQLRLIAETFGYTIDELRAP
jgi:predicted RNA binding protein YcfA (HicA-like mRNA interferase family)